MRSLIAFALTCVFSVSTYAFDHTHKEWTQTLTAYQDAKGLIKYHLLKADLLKFTSDKYASYLDNIQKVSEAEYSKWTANQQKSFLINAYNALTVKLILDNYPIKSIKKIGGLFTKPWSIKFFKLLDGKIQTLDQIEHEWLRPKFKDYRIHAAVNCASMSCPPLRHEAFVANKLDQQLDEQMSVWLNDPTRNDIPEGKSITVSKIFDWYKDDFNNWGGGVAKVIAKHKPAKLPDDVVIKFLDYDWSLNE
jgi:hypothetical protein